VAASIDPTSVLIKPLTSPRGTSILEQNYEFDLVGAAALLEKYLDEEILVVTKDGKEYRGKLLSGRGDLVLQESGGRVTVIKVENVQEFSFPELPQGLITRPTLVWLVRAGQSGPEELEVTHLTGGISWQADYVLLLAADEGAIDLDGWVTLTNTSGATFPEAQLKLIAGDLQRFPEPGMAARDLYMQGAPTPTEAAVQQREFFEYHLYQVPRPVTIQDNQTKTTKPSRSNSYPPAISRPKSSSSTMDCSAVTDTGTAMPRVIPRPIRLTASLQTPKSW